MSMSRKNEPSYFIYIEGVYPRIEALVVSFPIDKMLFNTVFVIDTHYFIILEQGFGVIQ